MDRSVDATTVAALETQARELTQLLWRLQHARRMLLPGPVDFWRGLTRIAFDTASAALSSTLDDAIATLHCAIDSTRGAIAGMHDRG